MKKQGQSPKSESVLPAGTNSDSLPGYPSYPSSEDIFKKSKEEPEIDPEDISQRKKSSKKEEKDMPNELGFEDDLTGEDLDVPGSEDDELEENFGMEDEENNYYSLGGDDHLDLEEDLGDDLSFLEDDTDELE